MLDIDAATPALAPPWPAAQRAVFRFVVVYFSSYILLTQMLGSLVPLPTSGIPNLGELGPGRALVEWTARHVFRVTHALVITGSGSGDKTFDWVQVFCLLVFAILGTALWTLLDRRRTEYRALDTWFRVFLRFALGATMISYGMAKAIPLQMPAPFLTRLLERYGEFSPMGVLWSSVGASRSYEVIVGSMELLAGTLLFVPRLTAIGALVCLVDGVQIFTLNMTYDVPVKLFSFHIILMSLVLFAPYARATVDLLVRRTRRVGVAVVVAQLLVGAYIIGMNAYSGRQSWYASGGGAPTPALYGIWNIDRMNVNGVERSPLLTDYGRWRRLVIQSSAAILFERMDDSLTGYAAKIDTSAHTVTLSKSNDKAWKAVFVYQQRAPDRLVLDGSLDGHPTRLETTRFDQHRFPLVNRGFHWVQEFPFNR